MKSRKPMTNWNRQREARGEFDASGTRATVRMPRGQRFLAGQKGFGKQKVAKLKLEQRYVQAGRRQYLSSGAPSASWQHSPDGVRRPHADGLCPRGAAHPSGGRAAEAHLNTTDASCLLFLKTAMIEARLVFS